MTRIGPPALSRTWQLGLRIVGAGLLAATAAMHLDLYLTGYRTVPTIGPLFLLQIIAAFVLAAAVLVTGSRLAAAAGAGFALSTLGGYLLSVWIGLFGFKEVRTTAGITAGIIEVVAFAALAVLAAAPAGQPAAGKSTAGQRTILDRLQAGIPGALPAIAGLAVVALVLLGVAVAGSGGTTPSASGELRTTTIGGVTVLTNAKGFTLYWFAIDTPTKSNCSGSCAQYWPPVIGAQTAGSGISGTFGTIRRSDGSLQTTYNGHPLYTYLADSAPGQARGNNINLNGGLWHEMVVTG